MRRNIDEKRGSVEVSSNRKLHRPLSAKMGVVLKTSLVQMHVKPSEGVLLHLDREPVRLIVESPYETVDGYHNGPSFCQFL